MTSKDRTSTICKVLYYCCIISLFAMPILLVWVWLYADLIAASASSLPASAIQHPLPVWTKCLMVLLSATVMAPTYWGLFSIRQFLKACCAEDYLSSQNSRYLKRLAFGLFGTALLSPISCSILSVLLTIDNPPGQKMLTIGISSNQIILAAVGGLLFVLANLIQRASLIAEEHAQIV
ncbi:DUF2975 domain-containing protein [uncultured Gimesia sp.]|uniref:DUF2975 domain-containing protein n=1 Tax=uncultured Gimesia sp. TaxID=1678688 RepID=UPI002625F1DE|nr:DUF2975 domain-containing protein [uncultured Gimesia sp.]